MGKRRSNQRWLVGYLIRIGVGIILALILWQLIPVVLENAFESTLMP